VDASSPPVRFAQTLDVQPIARLYATAGRVHIRPVFPAACAERIHQSLQHEVPWQLNLNDGERAVSRDAASFDALPETERARVFDRVHASAARRFQYIYYTLALSDLYERGELRDLYLMRVHEFLNSPEFLDFARRVTGVHSIALADAQATCYRAGHFLTRHDDLAHGKKRIAAYVLNFTPRWIADWGGILQFIDTDGHIAEGYTPVFNALNLFRVPQPHSVSHVAPFAQAARLSITGWLREA
jgi:Rps23 Pro-64 3,4-dihydroxylase Tpa1-like proline 4-hydroxylase